jgi:hypothetical protein
MKKGILEDELRGKKSKDKKQYAILRISKIKSFGSLSGSSKHVNRDRETPNADENKTPDNEVLIGTNDPEQDVKNRLAEAGINKIRKNGVIAVDFVLTASPEYFRPDDPERAGYWHQDRLDAWKEKTIQHLKNEYGKNLVNATLHLDESTPHIHAYMVPINEKGRLTARDFFGRRDQLVTIQDKYAEVTASLGLERGERGSKAKHTSLKQYYARVNSEKTNFPSYGSDIYEDIKPKSSFGRVKEDDSNKFAENAARKVLTSERNIALSLDAKLTEATASNDKLQKEVSVLRDKTAKAPILEKTLQSYIAAFKAMPAHVQNVLKQEISNNLKNDKEQDNQQDLER